ncbi:thiamine phosphate synthase [Propionispora hippei]|uniref:Thiamine-phosphate synthase n=1 Tax=Propionispora hippei DSM 15287 TaxID=1123003 RepID=A0A1M6MPX3_9FIRM|nr:thiamine phosphate synthase [Propionispora hippei]SHJ85531.1 thiamine-phosphate pyrophosphorylase [Propionispora hippei DSM 15287]
MKDIDYSLYLVTDRRLVGGKDFYQSLGEALAGGVTLLQLREKEASSAEFYRIALKVKEICGRYDVPLIINDRLDIALAVDADGLHIGQQDLPLSVARGLLGRDKLIGVSATTLAEAQLAEADGADYLGIGAMYPTGTKSDARAVSLSELTAIRKNVAIPVVAIGGIGTANVTEVMGTGIAGVSVVSAILAQDDVRAAAQHLRQLIITA